ncbi:MAG TPA: hypothetical protein VFU31_28365 [Candidatus Binatia bacterium]|nr:hypothetical protein [Candidatus Binatia bacterium]
MEYINLGAVIEQAIARFSQNRIGERPPVFLVGSSTLPDVPWHDQSLKQLVRLFLYECLLANDPDAAIEICVRRREQTSDLNGFVGLNPWYWIQLRVSGRGLKVAEVLIDDLFASIGYRCEGWARLEESAARLGTFAASDKPEVKMIFCLELVRQRLRCDLLVPVSEPLAVPQPTLQNVTHAAPQT